MNSATKQRKEAMEIFNKIRSKNKNTKQQELARDIQKAVKVVRKSV